MAELLPFKTSAALHLASSGLAKSHTIAAITDDQFCSFISNGLECLKEMFENLFEYILRCIVCILITHLLYPRIKANLFTNLMGSKIRSRVRGSTDGCAEK